MGSTVLLLRGTRFLIFEWWILVKNLKTVNHLKTITMVSMETKFASQGSILDKLSEKLYVSRFWEGEQGFYKGGTLCPSPPPPPPPPAGAPKKSALDRVKVARNEVKNASFAQRSAHRDPRIWRPELIEPAAERKRRARGRRRSNRPTPTHRFCNSAIIRPIIPYNAWFFWVRRHHFTKTNWNISGGFWDIPGSVGKFELSKTLIWSQKRLGSPPNSLWKVLLRFFLKVNPMPIRKNSKLALVGIIPKQILSSFSSHKDRKTALCFFRLIRLSVFLSLSELKEKGIWLRKNSF